MAVALAVAFVAKRIVLAASAEEEKHIADDSGEFFGLAVKSNE